jgi:hypothetical protein
MHTIEIRPDASCGKLDNHIPVLSKVRRSSPWSLCLFVPMMQTKRDYRDRVECQERGSFPAPRKQGHINFVPRAGSWDAKELSLII